ncbi:D-alanine--D-alanine ligase [Herminiimonas sp. CN]|uniref:D-alanine--D-alanine ligase n=1 Tax=Herminiimonas sp. CN TaxID=1349818 RepID=UPI0004741F2B|nr:D-alanine--D-alanine ligase [Herminiimonas sp. CN]
MGEPGMIKEFGRVGVLFGGRSAEREVSLMSGAGVLQALVSKGVDAHGFDPAERSLAELAAEKFERVFIALHGRYGEDGTLQGALEQLGIPYTGPGVLASSIAMDKAMTKRVWMASALATPKFEMLTAQSNWDAVIAALGLPLIVKPAHEGSTLGLTKVTQAGQLPAAFALAAKYDSAVMAEEFISGMELTCPILGYGEQAKALPVIRIIAPDANYDYQNKYFSNDTQYLCPCGLPAEQERAIQELALASYRALGCRGWSRADVMVRAADNKPFLLEMNTSPGMTGHSLVPMSAKVTGLDYEDLCVEILRSAALDLTPSIDWIAR